MYNVLKTNINQMYLHVGGYDEILSMCYWDFISIIETLNENNKRTSGKTIIKQGIPQSTKDMITKAKQLRK